MIHAQKSIVFLYTHAKENPKKKLRKIVLLRVVSKRIKYLDTNLTNVPDLFIL